MKQIPFSIQTRKELDACIEQVQRETRKMKKVASVLVSVFADKADECMLAAMTQTIQATFPEAQVIGSVSTEEIINGTLMDHGIALTFTLFECSQVRAIAYDFHKITSEDAGRELLAILNADRNVVSVEVIAAGFHLEINPFFRQASKSWREIVFFGGLSDDGSLGQNGLVFAQNELIRHGLVAVVFSGSRLRVQISSSFGWKPLGRMMTITKMDGEFCMQELDHTPALEVFDRYLGIRNTDRFLIETLTFPFYFERNGSILARHPRRCREDGSMMFGADFREGEQVRLAYGDPGDILESAMLLQERLAGFRPEAIFMVSCVARWMLLGSDTEQELSVSRQLAPSSGFYAYGEFMRNKDGEILVSNMTLVTVGMREGMMSGRRDSIALKRPHFQKHRSIMAHLVKFIETTTQELEASNRELARLVKIDLLTELYNRAATEAGLRRLLAEARADGSPLSVMMLDVDDFKSINDHHGHAAGDETLKRIADILHRNTRRGIDIPGRWGGDEFMVVFRDTDIEAAGVIAERIRQLVADLLLPENAGKVTTSIGVVSADLTDTVESLFRKADAALYDAKFSHGKNYVVIHGDRGKSLPG